MTEKRNPIFTLGHSNHTTDQFMVQLLANNVTAVGDVRTVPASRYVFWFNSDAMKRAINVERIRYVFLGHELGGKRDEPECFKDGRVSFEMLTKLPAFKQGIDRVLKGSEQYRIALVCSEKDPIDCHRGILVARVLFEAGADVRHITPEGKTETHRELEDRLLERHAKRLGGSGRERLVAQAYSLQEEKVSYRPR